ncbi:MAG: alpha/beta fold hydrolase [Ostreibacterium sp.]
MKQFSLKQWLDACSEDIRVQKSSQGLNDCIGFSDGKNHYHFLCQEEGIEVKTVQSVQSPEAKGLLSTIIEAEEAAWDELLSGAALTPGWQSFGAIIRQNPKFKISGDFLASAQCLSALEYMFEVLHDLLMATDSIAETKTLECNAQQIMGQYASLGELGLSYQVYYETTNLSGRGKSDKPAMLMLHTAGADSRQYSEQLSDVALADTWDLYAFDMPGHGRSSVYDDWVSESEYLLTAERYTARCSEFIEKIIQKPVVLVGCSMGAAIALAVAVARPDLLTGVVALECP